jgi:ABC-2 type transport system ATP-binding protein
VGGARACGPRPWRGGAWALPRDTGTVGPQALLGDPAILILDEPTIGLDPEQVVEIRELVRSLRGRRTVLFSSQHGGLRAGRHRARAAGGEGAGPANGWAAASDRVAGRTAGVRARLPASRRVARPTVGGDAGGGVDLPRVVGDAVAAAGWRLRELREEPLALEEIFLRLVAGGAGS